MFLPIRFCPSIDNRISPAFNPAVAAGMPSYGSAMTERFSFGFQLIIEPIPP
ncbi:hypothetical protein EVA_22222 [gut metagenome]|uniref:Uncharacterized protein n=1 Tax=gut metagenome TaxID=749906 RepID=J9BQ22_9ZZZZ